jgi:hypothetical protein
MPQSMVTLTTLYPDMPYGMKPVYDPKHGSIVIEPASIGNFETIYEKEKKVIEIVEEKIAKGERVLIYTSWVSTDTQEKLYKALKEKGYRVSAITLKMYQQYTREWLSSQTEYIEQEKTQQKDNMTC